MRIKADPDPFVRRVRKKYDIVDKDAIDNILSEEKERMKAEPQRPWGNPPGIYWMQSDQEERIKEVWRRERDALKKDT